MSASVLSIHLIGYKIPAQRLTKTTEERGCSHEPTFGGRFCAECGAPKWKTREEKMLHDSDEIGEFTVRTAGWEEREVAYIGSELSGKYVSINTLGQIMTDLPQMRERLHSELGKLGINYADCVFGLHLIEEIC
jgi:hypothetical protein